MRSTPSTLAGSAGWIATLIFSPHKKRPSQQQRTAGLVARFHLNRSVKWLQSLGWITGHRHHVEDDHNHLIKATRTARTQSSLALNTGSACGKDVFVVNVQPSSPQVDGRWIYGIFE